MAKYTKYLECVFSDSEMTLKAKELAEANRKRTSIEQRKREVDSSLKAAIEEQNSIIARLSDQINRGKEDRDVECRIDLDTPAAGQKTIIRLDTGEIVSIERMTDEDKQLALDLQAEADKQEAEAVPEARRIEAPGVVNGEGWVIRPEVLPAEE